MKAVLVGPFWIPGAGRLAGRISERGASGSTAVFDHHESQLVTLTPHERVTTVATPHGDVRILEGTTQIGFAVLDVEVDNRSALHALEPRAKDSVDAALADHYATQRDPAADGYPRGVILWWHRLLLEPGDDAPRAIRLFGEQFLASDDVSGCVADGFTSLDSSADSLIDDVIKGLLAATEDWLILDALSKGLASTLLNTRGDDQILGRALSDAEQLTEEVALSVLLIDERRRHLANTVHRVHEAAHRVWGLGSVRESLLRNAESVQSLIRLEHSRREARLDARRNNILFGFTAVTVLQSVLLILDFGTADSMTASSSARIAIAAMTALLTLVILLRYMLQGTSDRDAPPAAAPVPDDSRRIE